MNKLESLQAYTKYRVSEEIELVSLIEESGYVRVCYDHHRDDQVQLSFFDSRISLLTNYAGVADDLIARAKELGIDEIDLPYSVDVSIDDLSSDKRVEAIYRSQTRCLDKKTPINEDFICI